MSIHKSLRRRRMSMSALAYASHMYEALDTPTSLSCYLMLKYNEHEQLVRKEVDPAQYMSPDNFWLDYQSVKLMSKYPFLDTGIDTQAVAYLKFLDAESSCRETNERFRRRCDGHLFDARVERVISRAQRKIMSILGRVPSYEVMDFAFGPGAAYGVRGETSVYNKVSANLECTYAMADKLQEFLEEFPAWIPPGIHAVSLIPGSQLTFVPKDAKTDRPICIEPLLNGLYQKGVGSWLRRRLRKFGVNLDDQGVNQKLASLAIERKLATVDFSSASDTIAYHVVLDLLPIDWFEFLDVARCPRFEDPYAGCWKNFQKFSSMGNAYTFELETLIFYALACGCCEELGIAYDGDSLSVYGDDVIIPQRAFDLYHEVTKCCGFTINEKKSFSKGLFYESCGHDYFNGVYVRPILLREKPNKLPVLTYVANSALRTRAGFPEREPKALNLGTIPDRKRVQDRLLALHSWVVGHIPRDLRLYGPEGYGDGHIVCDLAYAERHGYARRHPIYCGWTFSTYTEQAVRISLTDVPLGYALYFKGGSCRLPAIEDIPEPTDNGSGYVVRGKTRLRRTRTLCHYTWRGIERA